jgi:hypothetical protein
MPQSVVVIDCPYSCLYLNITTEYNIKIKFCVCDKIEKNEVGGACSTYGRGERRVQAFGGENGGKETTGENHE